MQEEETSVGPRRRAGGFFDKDGNVTRWHGMHSYDRALASEGLIPRVFDSEVDKHLLAYRNRQQPFLPFVMSLVGHFQRRLSGVKVEDAKRVAADLTERRWQNVYVFTRELIAAAQTKTPEKEAMPCFLISGSPSQIVEPFAQRLGFVDSLASDYPHTDGVYTGEPATEWISRKGEAVRLLAERHDIDLSQSFAIGDTLTDAPMFCLVKYPICFNPSRDLYDFADAMGWPVVIERKDLILVLICEGGRSPRRVGNFSHILPEPLASILVERLRAINYL